MTQMQAHSSARKGNPMGFTVKGLGLRVSGFVGPS